MSEDDAALWVRVRAGDESALADLFDRHEPRLFRHASRLLSRREDAKDAVSVAFLDLWRLQASVRLAAGSTLPWLLVAVSTAARDLDRAARRYRAVLDRPSTGAVLESPLLVTLARLSEREHAVVALSVVEGFAEDVVADAVGIPVRTVSSRLERAMGRMRGGSALVEVSS